MLENENISIPGHNSWGICGTEDPTSGKSRHQKTLRNINQYEHILICHQPRVLRAIECGIRPNVSAVMLAGHTHGTNQNWKTWIVGKGKLSNKFQSN